jgi:UDP-N-acetylglucosamine diphosphorylase/glucosamine-1-phosphate N-acetyltransferase
MSDKNLAVAIMAAGKGTRMKDPSRAKVMFPVGGVPMIHHVVERAFECGADRVIAIIGYQRDAVREYLDGAFGGRVEIAEQLDQLGTGHAVMQAMPLLDRYDGDLLVLSGDVPLLTTGTLLRLADVHKQSDAVATVLTVRADDPTGYGRVVRNDDSSVARIVEQKDASDEERRVDEINSGIYLFRIPDLAEALANLTDDNAQGEYYLTDVFAWFRAEGRRVAAYRSDDFSEIQGINTVDQLSAADMAFNARESVDRKP